MESGIVNFFPENPLNRKFRVTELDDSVASQTEWKPLKTQKLREFNYRLCIKEDRAYLKPSLTIYFLIFLIFTMTLSFVLLPMVKMKSDVSAYIKLGVITSFLLFLCLLFLRTNLYFDKSINLFWSGSKKIKAVNSIEFSEIYAIQLIDGDNNYVLAADKTFDICNNYELNLILSDGKRIGVINQESLWGLKKIGKKLSLFLNVPLWDATI